MTKKHKKPKFCSFFAGIGGFDYALESQGFIPGFQCEINSFCQQVLKWHWPDVKLASNIVTIEASSIPDADLWCGGFPCQDVSVARGAKGRDGLGGKNSGLFYPFAELIDKKRPKILLIENVTGLLSSHNGQDFRIILETLSSMGYTVAWRVLNSRYFGSPQSRPRVFICASLENHKIALSTLYESIKGTRPSNKRTGFLTASTCNITGAKVAKVAYCLAATSGRHTGTDWSRTYVSYDSAVRRLTPTECEGIQGFPAGWTRPPHLNVDEDVDNDTPRYQALGNAVAVPVVKWIAKRLNENVKACQENDLDFIATFDNNYEDFRHKSKRHMNLSNLHLSTQAKDSSLKWQTGGLVIGDDCWDIKAPEAPSVVIEKDLIDIVETEYPSERYFLSPNAAEGILRRVYSQNRTLFEPMHNALQNMIKKTNVA